MERSYWWIFRYKAFIVVEFRQYDSIIFMYRDGWMVNIYSRGKEVLVHFDVVYLTNEKPNH